MTWELEVSMLKQAEQYDPSIEVAATIGGNVRDKKSLLKAFADELVKRAIANGGALISHDDVFRIIKTMLHECGVNQ